MDVKLKPFDFSAAVARAGLRPDGQPLGRPQPAQAPEGSSFQTAMQDALKSTSGAQLQAQAMQREYQVGNPNVGAEETMVAMVKAQVAFQGVLAVRNRMVQAYSEIMNMQV
ncbi:MAG: flagellar hook-basal body complex protein FliE [Aquabacterium sp.]